jgi:hypothetical protein
MAKRCKYIYKGKTYTKEEFMAMLAGGEYENILASAEQPIKVKLSRGSKEFVDATKEVAAEVESKVVPGKRQSTWVENETKNTFTTDISLDEVRNRKPQSYVSAINTLASSLSDDTYLDEFVEQMSKFPSAIQKQIISKANDSYAQQVSKLKAGYEKTQNKIKVLQARQEKSRAKGYDLNEIDLDDLLSYQSDIEYYQKIFAKNKLAAKNISELVSFIKEIPILSVKAKMASELIYSKQISKDKKGNLLYKNKNIEQSMVLADDMVGKMTDVVVSNLLAVYDSVDEGIRNLSKLWYDGANLIAQEFSNQYGLSLEQTAAIIGTQSPQKPWFQNLHIAQAVMDIMSNNSEDVFTEEDFNFYKSKAKGYDKQVEKIPQAKSIIGKKLKDLTDLEASWFIRSRFEREMSRMAPIRIPSGNIVGYEKGMSSYSGYDTISKAVSIFRDGSEQNISEKIGDANKVRNFYNNIVDPTNSSDVTMDTHAMAIALLKPLGSSSFEVNFSPAHFAFYADAYRKAAEMRGISAREMQSITWEAARAIFPAKEKTAAKKSRVQSIWNSYFNKNITLQEAQQKIFKDGKNPNITEWSGYTDSIFDAEQRKDIVRDILRQSRVEPTSKLATRARNNSGASGLGGGRARSNATGNVKTKSKQSKGIGKFDPLPGAPKTEGITGPDPNLVSVAENYAKKFGIPFTRQAEYVKVDEDRAKRISDAYENMKHDPKNPKVLEAFNDLIRQTKDQYDALTEAGYEFSFFDGDTDPYNKNPSKAMRDLRNNKKMAVYGTYAGYGTEGITGASIEGNPMLQDTGLKWKDQNGVDQTVTMNDLFRAVHDAFGHGLEGAGFRARGEENAWQAHVRLFTGPAVAAITTETRGQNSWLNYGPFGEQNRKATVDDTVFAEQKTGLMPEWTWNEGKAEAMPEQVDDQDTQAVADSSALFEKSQELFEKISDAAGGSKKRSLAEERRKFMDENPDIKFMDENMAYIYRQIEDNNLGKKEGNCPL